MAVTQQSKGESGVPRCLCGESRGGAGGDAPARCGGAGHFRGGEAGEHDHGARRLRRQHEAARRLEVERLGCAPDLGDDGGDRPASGGFGGGAQNGHGVASRHVQHGGRVEAEGAKAVGRQRPDLARDYVLLGPDDGARGPVRRGALGEGGGEAAGGRGVGLASGDDLMQGGAQEAAIGGGIKGAMVEADAAWRGQRQGSGGVARRGDGEAGAGGDFGARGRAPGRFEFGQASPQRRELFSRRGHVLKRGCSCFVLI